MTQNKNWTAPKDTAVISVDLTDDFVPAYGDWTGGALAVDGGNEVIPVANAVNSHFQVRIFTKEEHHPRHTSFASQTSGKVPVQDKYDVGYGPQFYWPDHCVRGTRGTQFHQDLDVSIADQIVVKGTDPNIHAYSAFRMDDRKTDIVYPDGKTLAENLRDQGIKRLVVHGLAYDFCAGMTALDAAAEGFEVIFVHDASASINIPYDIKDDDDNVIESRTTVQDMDEQLSAAGVWVVDSADLPNVLEVDGHENTLGGAGSPSPKP